MAGYSEFWGDDIGKTGSYSISDGRMPRREAIKRVVNRAGFRSLTELFDSLIGAAAGGTASASHKQIKGSVSTGTPINQGGVVEIETVTDINRATTAADVTALKEMVFNVKTAPASYPANGNGLNQKQF